MLLPKSLLNKFSSKPNQSGQVVIIFLLILVIGLAVVLSIASRTATNIRQSTTSDESNRAYFAAEAGIEQALKKISENSTFTTSGTSVNFSTQNQSSANYVVSDLGNDSSGLFEVPGTVAKDDVVQIYLISDYSSTSTVGTGASIRNTDTLSFYWGDPSLGAASATSPVIEISVLNCNSGCGTFTLSKMVFDPYSSRGIFCSNLASNSNANYKYKATVVLNSNTGCTGTGGNDVLAVGNNPVLLRIRFLYATGSVKLAVESNPSTNGGRVIPRQGQKITSTGKTPSGVTRKLTVNKFYPSLPALFDYSVYDGSTCPFTKGSSSC